MKILIVDDDQDDADLLFEAVRESVPMSDCRVALSGLAASSMFENFIPDIVFLDAIMYPTNGKDILSSYARRSEFRYTHFVVYSGALHPDQHHEFMALGAKSVLTKPGDYDSLLTKVISVVAPNAVNIRVKLYTNETIVHTQTNSIQDLLQRVLNFDIELNTRKPNPNIQFMVSEVELTRIHSELGMNVLHLQGGHWLPKI